MSRIVLALSSLLLASGCSSIPWFGGEEDPRPPTELTDINPEVGLSVLWSEEIGEGTDNRRLSLVPAYEGGRLFVADAEGLVTALDAASGRVLWQRETRLPFSGGPALSAGSLILGSSNGDLVALSSRDGSERWRTGVSSEILSVPAIAADTVVLHTLDDSIYGFDMASGELRWEYRYRAPVLTLRGSSSPVIVGEHAIVGISDGKLVKLAVDDGEPIWEATVTRPRGRSELERIADLDASPVVEGDIVYVCTFNGDLAAVDLASGSVLWRRSLSAHAGLTTAGGILYVTDSEDRVWAAEPDDGAGVWKQEALRYRRLSAPAVIGELVIVGDLEGYVHALSRRDGRIVARKEVADGPITSRPLVANGRIYVYADDGTIATIAAGGAARKR
jgi:outer membrane protein assembly factor BamB